MTVRQILKSKGGTVHTNAPDASLSDVVRVLAAKKIGALVLVDRQGVVAGIVSERDVVRVIATSGPQALASSVRDIMTLEVVTCGEDTTIDEAMQLMTKGRFRHLPVIADGGLVGIVSIGDIVKRRIEDAEREAQDMREYIAAG